MLELLFFEHAFFGIVNFGQLCSVLLPLEGFVALIQPLVSFRLEQHFIDVIDVESEVVHLEHLRVSDQSLTLFSGGVTKQNSEFFRTFELALQFFQIFLSQRLIMVIDELKIIELVEKLAHFLELIIARHLDMVVLVHHHSRYKPYLVLSEWC